jgi:hypothetical protein
MEKKLKKSHISIGSNWQNNTSKFLSISKYFEYKWINYLIKNTEMD